MSSYSITQISSGEMATPAGNPATDTATVVISSSGGITTFTLNDSALLGGGSAISLTSEGSSSQDGITVQLYQGTISSASDTFNVKDFGQATGLDYSTFGSWQTVSGGATVAIGYYSVGSQTTTMPTSGTATYNGSAIGSALFNNLNEAFNFNGTVTLNANFGNDSISGSISNINAYATGSNNTIGTFNNINLTGGTISGNGFSGTAASASATGTAAVNISGATGAFQGNFYGPSAQEVGGTFNMFNNGTGTFVTGSFGAKQ